MSNEQALLILDKLSVKGESKAEQEAIRMAIRCMEKEIAYRIKAIELLKDLVS